MSVAGASCLSVYLYQGFIQGAGQPGGRQHRQYSVQPYMYCHDVHHKSGIDVIANWYSDQQERITIEMPTGRALLTSKPTGYVYIIC